MGGVGGGGGEIPGLLPYKVAWSKAFLLTLLLVPPCWFEALGQERGKLNSLRFFIGGFLGSWLQDVYKTLNQFEAQRFSIREADCADRVKRPVASEDHSI